MNVFVTGAAGYIGKAVVRRLAEREHAIVGLVRDEAGARAVRALGAEAHVADLSDHAALAELARRADGVVHLALELGPDAGAIDERAIAALLGPLRGTGKAYVGASAAALVGDTRGRVVAESTPLPREGPNAWRAENEQRVLAAKNEGVRAVAVRPAPMVFGRNGGKLLPALLADARVTGSGHHIGDGTNAWSAAYVDDVANLFVLALERAPAGEVYFAVSDEPTAWKDIATAVSRQAGCDGRTATWTTAEATAALGFFGNLVSLDVRVPNARARALGWAPRGPALVDEIALYAVPA